MTDEELTVDGVELVRGDPIYFCVNGHDPIQMTHATPAQDAVTAYRQLRNLPPDWAPDWGSMEWNWFKIGWDACWINASAGSQPFVEENQ